MTTLRQIVTDAFREGGIIQIGTDPEADQFDEGLRKLQSIFIQVLGNEAGEPLTTISYGAATDTNSYAGDYDRKDVVDSYFLPSNVRLLVQGTGVRTVYLNPDPQPGARFSVVDVSDSFVSGPVTVKANGRVIDGASSVVLNTNGTNSQWFYRDDLAEWVRVTDLAADSESPFPTEFDDLFSIEVAMRLNPRYQAQTAPETIQTYRRLKSQFRSRYRQTEFTPSDVAQLYKSGYYSLNSQTVFSKGLIA